MYTSSVLSFLERGIPWHRARQGEAHLLSSLRRISPVERTMRGSDYLLTVELVLGDSLHLSRTFQTAKILNQQVTLWEESPQWLIDCIDQPEEEGQLTCRIFIVNNQNTRENKRGCDCRINQSLAAAAPRSR